MIKLNWSTIAKVLKFIATVITSILGTMVTISSSWATLTTDVCLFHSLIRHLSQQRCQLRFYHKLKSHPLGHRLCGLYQSPDNHFCETAEVPPPFHVSLTTLTRHEAYIVLFKCLCQFLLHSLNFLVLIHI